MKPEARCKHDRTIDATGRLAKSSHAQYYAGDAPSTNSLEHTYSGASHIQNFDGSNYGSVWHWAGAANAHAAPLKSPNPDTASQPAYNIAAQGGKGTPQRRTWTSPTVEGNKREVFGQGRPMAKDSSGNGANWWQGTRSDPPVSGTAVESRFFFEGTVAPTDMSRATDSREASRIGIFGTSNSYGGSYGRVTNEALGRDLNPLGRGAGQALVAGMLNVGRIMPGLPGSIRAGGKQGNGANNPPGGAPVEPGPGGGASCDCGGTCEGTCDGGFAHDPCCGRLMPNGICDCTQCLYPDVHGNPEVPWCGPVGDPGTAIWSGCLLRKLLAAAGEKNGEGPTQPIGPQPMPAVPLPAAAGCAGCASQGPS